MADKRKKKLARLLEFFIIGVVMGTIEDSIAVWFVAGQGITIHNLKIIVPIAGVFAFISEYIVDHPKFWKTLGF